MKATVKNSTPPSNREFEGAIFISSRGLRVSGQLRLGGADRPIRGVIELNNGQPYIRAEINLGSWSYDIQLEPTQPSGNRPNWSGEMRCKQNSEDWLELVAWTNTSANGQTYLRIRGTPVGRPSWLPKQIFAPATKIQTIPPKFTFGPTKRFKSLNF
jgi:hypothetical protein